MSKSNYLENALLGHVLGGTVWTRPANLYFALFTQLPTDLDPGIEVAGNGYARKQMVNDNTLFNAPASGQTTNLATIEFPVATGGGQGTIVGFAIFDAASGGNMIYYGALNTPRVINIDDIPVFSPGVLVISED